MVKWNAHSRVLFIPISVDHNHAHFMCLIFSIRYQDTSIRTQDFYENFIFLFSYNPFQSGLQK